MTPSIPENFWLVDWSLVTIIDSTMPPRDPDDDDEGGISVVRSFGLTVGRIIVIPGAARAFSGVEG
jgi:hypothetical protein